jgi:cytochrome c-type biogenesis protein CcmH
MTSRRSVGAWWMAMAIMFVVSAALAADAPPAAPSPALEARLKKLETELRCLVCQNQTLADSNADLAGDLRREVRELALAGKNDAEIRDYLVARYGDFVLYDPPLKRATWLLWFGPFALLIGGGWTWWQVLKRRQRASASAPTHDPAAEARARELLDDDTPASPRTRGAAVPAAPRRKR